MLDGYFGDKFLEDLTEKCEQTRDSKKCERDKALVAALFLTGGHVQEVLKLRKSNFDFHNEEASRHNAFLVRNIPVQRYERRGKRKLVTRTVPIWRDDPLVEYLLEWLEKVEDYLFPSTGGKDPFMTRQGANHVIKTLGQRLDMPVYITAKDLREQRMYHLAERRGFSRHAIQAYVSLKSPPDISGSREDWQNLLYVARLPREEKIYENRPYDTYKYIKNILTSARREVDIIDAYVDVSLFELYLENVDKNADIKLITRKMYGDFRQVAQKFKIQRPSFQLRTSDDIHDRYLIADGRSWIIGQSLRHAGIKPLYIIELNDRDRVHALFGNLWRAAKRIL